MMADDSENIVMLRIPAALYAIMVQEMGFLARVPSYAQHNRENAELAATWLLRAGGADVVELDREGVK